MPIHHATVSVDDLTPTDREQMYQLLDTYYLGGNRSAFERDLSEKCHAMLLRNEEEQIVGFSTLMSQMVVVNQEPAVVIFSGDTIVSTDARMNIGFAREITSYF